AECAPMYELTQNCPWKAPPVSPMVGSLEVASHSRSAVTSSSFPPYLAPFGSQRSGMDFRPDGLDVLGSDPVERPGVDHTAIIVPECGQRMPADPPPHQLYRLALVPAEEGADQPPVPRPPLLPAAGTAAPPQTQ